MAYLTFAETAGGDIVETVLNRRAKTQDTGFSAFEWSVVAIAQRDRL